MENQTEQHTITIENRKRITATQIEAVDAFSSSKIILSYQGGRIAVEGSGMKISAFSKTSGQFSANGIIDGVKYISASVGLKKFFK